MSDRRSRRTAAICGPLPRIASPDPVGPFWKAMLRVLAAIVAVALVFSTKAQVTVPVVTATNRVVRIAAANLSSGNSQTYEGPGIRILQGLRPDVIAMQEFNHAANTAGDIQALVDQITGTNGSAWFRESGYAIPNGIISRWPILSAGSWVDADTGVNDRGFAWARIDVPGSNDLHVVSVHFKASSGSANELRREAQATQLKGLIQSNFPANAWIVVAGDLNTYNTNEAPLQVLGTFLKTSPDAADNLGDPDTNAGRTAPYDHVFASPGLATNQVATTIGAQNFVNGLVFDSRVFTPLSSVAPVQSTDSGASSMQHMAVLKDYRINHSVTNLVTLTPPLLTLQSSNRIVWSGPSNLTFQVETSAALSAWAVVGASSSTATNYAFTNASPASRLFFRVRFP